MSESSAQLALDLEARKTQRARVLFAMSDHQWHSLDDLIGRCDFGTTASMSARVRDLRKEQYGRHKILVQRIGSSGLYLYKLA